MLLISKALAFIVFPFDMESSVTVHGYGVKVDVRDLFTLAVEEAGWRAFNEGLDAHLYGGANDPSYVSDPRPFAEATFAHVAKQYAEAL